MVTVAEGAKKCGPLKSIHCQLKRKRQMMDRVKTKQCADILKKLMNHEAGWVFKQPVDPVALNIPDYFDVISEPMDFGTIKSKLEKDLYVDVKEFVADVRLTFSNAMRYNPPSNPVHIMAKELNDIFSMRWKALELKWIGESAETFQKSVAEKPPKRCQNSKQVSHKLILPKRVMTAVDKQKLRKDLAALSNQNMPTPLLKFLQRFGSAPQIKERIEVDVDVFDEQTAWELYGIVKSCLEARSTASSVVKSGEHGTLQSLNTVKSGSAGDIQTSSNDLNCGRLPMKSRKACQDGVLNLDRLACNTNSTTASALDGSSIHDFDGDTKRREEKSVHPGYLPATPERTCKEGFCDLGSKDLIYDEQLSPSKALRAAMLKSRFADTILKAQNKTLLSHGEKADPVKMHEERVKLERRQQEEKARIEAQVRAAEAAAQMRTEAEMKRRREREREAARLALQKMEKTVEIDENREILKDLEVFGYFNSNDLDALLPSPVSTTAGFQGNPLEQLGLFIKDDYVEDEDDLYTEVEEGEIGS
ncbi:transcription factor GTE9-like isoform X2 [Aristolochia californica]|uniref:transcription factor GTE9-like isoform X2 n=1 Tax=Aristolochia californica TaxID=171875 RepID=UPI0035D6102E